MSRHRILVHDYAGHPFPAQLSRWLAAHQNEVLHLYSAAIRSPRGQLKRITEDPPDLLIEPVTLPKPVDKYNLLRRRFQERVYARKLIERMQQFRPDVVLSGNSPPEVQALLLKQAQQRKTRFVTWLQDIYAIGLARIMPEKLPFIGHLAAALAGRIEYSTLRQSDAVIAITDDFQPLLERQGIARNRISVIQNWAPLEEVLPGPRKNDWAKRQGLEGRFVFLYAGTLGMKHDPSLLSGLACHFRNSPQVAVIVVSEGLGRDWLEQTKRHEGLENLILLDFQAYDQLSQTLASADVLLAVLEPLAGVFSVPSKVLTYLCTNRPLLAAVPKQNLAARLIRQTGSGFVTDPQDRETFFQYAEQLLRDATTRSVCAARGRAYAETAFNIDAIGQRFLNVLIPKSNRNCLPSSQTDSSTAWSGDDATASLGLKRSALPSTRSA